MYEKEMRVLEAYVRGKINRRELITSCAKLGVAAGLGSVLLARVQTSAMAADFDWKKYSQTKLKLLLSKHAYSDALIANIQAFNDLTGIELAWDVFPEDTYFDKLSAAVSSGASDYDAFMTGAYMAWTHGPAGRVTDLNAYIRDPEKTNPAYDWDDVLPGLRAATSWDGVPGGELGTADAQQWSIPWGYSLTCISYNRRMFDKAGVEPPKNLDEMAEVSARLSRDLGGPYGIGVSGSRSWEAIHAGFMSAYANFGEKDFIAGNGKLKAAMNSAVSKTFHKAWTKMTRDSGPKDWPSYASQQAGVDLGSGACAMIYDADTLGYLANNGVNTERGNIGFAPFAANPAAQAPTPNVWIWSLAMNNAGVQKDATWYFLQWATSVEHDLFGARKMDFVNPVRASVLKDQEFGNRVNQTHAGYLEQYKASAPGAKVQFTAQPLFFDLATLWSENLRKMVANEIPVDDSLDMMAAEMDARLAKAGLG